MTPSPPTRESVDEWEHFRYGELPRASRVGVHVPYIASISLIIRSICSGSTRHILADLSAFLAISTDFSALSMPIYLLPRLKAAKAVVPLPMKQSSTISLGSV